VGGFLETGSQYDYTQQLQTIHEDLQTIIALIHQIDHVVVVSAAILGLYFTIKWLYRFFGGLIFGGV
jgi:hypothetical protein